MYYSIPKLILAALAILVLVVQQYLSADPGWGPRIDKITFIQPYTPGPNGETAMMLIDGKNFTANSRVLVDGEKVSSGFPYDGRLQVYVDACSVPERHTVVVEDRDYWGQTVKSKGYKADFCW